MSTVERKAGRHAFAGLRLALALQFCNLLIHQVLELGTIRGQFAGLGKGLNRFVFLVLTGQDLAQPEIVFRIGVRGIRKRRLVFFLGFCQFRLVHPSQRGQGALEVNQGQSGVNSLKVIAFPPGESIIGFIRHFLELPDKLERLLAILLGFVGKLAALVNTIPVAVAGGLSIYLFGVIGMQGVALIQSEKVNLFDPRQLAVGATILVTGIGGAMGLKDGLYPFQIPILFPNGIPAIVFAAIAGILLNLIFLVLPPSLFGVKERENINQ